MIYHVIIGVVIGLILGFGAGLFFYRILMADIEEAAATLLEAKAEISKLRLQLDDQRRHLEQAEIISAVRRR